MLKGRLRLRAKSPGKSVVDLIMRPGDFVLTGPNEHHALVALQDSELMVFTKGPRGGKEYETDTYRLKIPLIKPRS